ncbi:unnamed protein product [Rotaria sp. Silwood2]|nr:unnamed protein product [Rotaria sp. Silwood2]CAF4091658.1 unnamed protein product [Rotaria sp. Silwood2]
MQDGRHEEWVLFRHGSLYIQTMPNNEETSHDELINKAKNSLSQVIVGPGSPYGDTTVCRFNYENAQMYYSYIGTFDGIIMIHPSEQVKNDMIVISLARRNILNDKQNPIVVTTGNTKQT